MTAPTVEAGRVMVLMRITYTASGTPVTDEKVLKELGATPSPEPGWFWRKATPGSAARMAHHGHRAVGTLTTSYMPFVVGAPLEPGQSTCRDYNDGKPHAPHRMDPHTRTLVCQGIPDPADAGVTSFSTFCPCPEPLLTGDGECLVCGTRWAS